MARSSSQLETFIRAVHRRWIVCRALERAGIGLLVGCAAALILYPILLWRGEPAMATIFAALGLGAACGLIFGLKSCPSRLDAATEVDRQLKLHDLLSSALSASNSKIDEWSSAVIAMAEAKCQSIAPREVILNRLGVRAWGGIGLSAALVLALGILSTNPIVTQAVATASGRTAANSTGETPRTTEPFVAVQPHGDLHHPSGPRDEDRSQIPQSSDAKGGSDEHTSSNHRDNASDGMGAGQSQTGNKSRSSLAHAASPSASRGEGGTRAGAGGAAASNPERAGENTGATVSAQTQGSVPAWQSSNWSSAREQALRDVRDGKTPPAYHDLIRDYFNRDGVDHQPLFIDNTARGDSMTTLDDEPIPAASPDNRTASFALLIATFFWGAAFTWAKAAGERVLHDAGLPPGAALGPMLVLGWRFILAGILWTILFPGARRGWSGASVVRTLIIAVPLGLGMIAQHLGLDRTSEAVAAFLTSLTIIFVPLVMTIALRRPPAPSMWIGVITAGIGIYLMTGPTPTGFGRGEVFGLFASILFTFYILAVNALMPLDDPMRLTAGQFFVAGGIALLSCLFVDGGERIMLSSQMATLVFSKHVVVDLALLVVVPTLGAYGLLNRFQPRVDATRAALIYMVEPIFASAFAWYMTGRGLATAGLIGAALILLANLVVELLAARTRIKVVVLD